MLSHDGLILRISRAIPLFLLLLSTQKTECQEGILDSLFSFRTGTIKTGDALEIITGQTGYNFTYDSRLIDKEQLAEMNFINVRLVVILDSILKNNTLTFSVIDKYIIISRAETTPSPPTDSLQQEVTKYLTGVIVDEETSEPLPFATI
jgi:hypothetical protein